MSTRKKAQNIAAQDDEPTNQSVSTYGPTREEIRERAYESYIQRGRIDGFHLEDWLQAESDLKQNGNKSAR